ncbi:MAG: FtsX-like permease family protein [Chloroflexota bacterium]
MAAPIVSLVLARLRRRGATALISMAAVGAAAALIAIVTGIGLIAADATVARTLAGEGADRPLVRISRFAPTATDYDTIMARTDGGISQHLAGLTTAPVRGVITRELRDLKQPVFELVVAVDQPEPLVTIVQGRLPKPCVDHSACEAMLLSETEPDFDFTSAQPAPNLDLAIVGRGIIDPAVPFGDLDQRGAFGEITIGGGDYQTGRRSPAVLLVNGVGTVSHMPAFDVTGRTYVWTAPVDVAAIHPWTADTFHAAVEGMTRDLLAVDPAYTIESPLTQIGSALALADASSARLLLIGSLGVAILLAFAVFLALVVRDDVAAEVARLTAVGARRRDRVTFLVLEAGIPAVIGGVIGWIGGALAVALLAGWAAANPVAIVSGATLAPGSLAAAFLVILVAVVTTVFATAPGRSWRGGVRTIVAIVLTAIIVLAWQLASTGPLDTAALARSVSSPVVVLLPPAVAFVAALLLATTMPPLLRAITRRSRRAPLALRLSLLSLSRDPGRPAATVTLLAFSVGAIVFATCWSATLRAGIDDAAAYRSGLDLRVTELGTGLSIAPSVVPVDRYAKLGPGVQAIPVFHEGSTSGPGARVDVLGVDPAVLPTLPGWRPDFSATPVQELAARLHVDEPPNGWAVAGHRLPAGRPDLDLRFRYTGDPLKLDAVVWTDEGDTVRIPLGTITEGMTHASAALPKSAIGGRLTSLVFFNAQLVAGSGHQHGVYRSTVRFEGLDGLVDERDVPLEIFTVAVVMIKAPQVTDGLVLPAVVSPDLAKETKPDGTLDLHVGSGTIPVRVVGTADRVPTVVDADPRFVIVPLDPFIVALASAVPGSGRPSEMWLSVPDPQRQAEVRAALAKPPFRFAQVTARSDLVAQQAGDPLTQAIVWAQIVAALAGLTLSIAALVMGAITDLRDERGELADLEAQGVSPSALRWHALARTAWLAIGGCIAGLVAGLALAVTVTGALAIDAEGRLPIPPLVVVLPPLQLVAVVVGVLVTVLGTVALLAARTYGRSTLGERRGGRAKRRTGAWTAGTERVDG